MSFNAKFDLSYAVQTNPELTNEWEIHGSIIDNSGTYFPTDSKVGDVIYIDSYEGIKRYVVTEIINASSEYVANVRWDMIDAEPFEPTSGYQGLIGSSTGKFKLTTLTSWTINDLAESFINNIKNYELQLIENGALNSPEFNGKPLTPTPDKGSNDKQIANTEWVNQKLEGLQIICKGEVKEFTAGEVLDEFKFVYLGSDNKVRLANANNVQCADAIVGVTTVRAEAEQKVQVLMEGCATNEQWNFDNFPETLFVGLNGDTIKNPNPEYKFIQQVGLILDNKTINIEIEESILI